MLFSLLEVDRVRRTGVLLGLQSAEHTEGPTLRKYLPLVSFPEVRRHARPLRALVYWTLCRPRQVRPSRGSRTGVPGPLLSPSDSDSDTSPPVVSRSDLSRWWVETGYQRYVLSSVHYGSKDEKDLFGFLGRGRNRVLEVSKYKTVY